MVELRIDNSEKVKYNSDIVPLYAGRGRLSSYPDFREVAHWHNDIELIAVLSGSMDFCINGEVVRIEGGESLFVGSRNVHYGFSDEGSECDFLCVLMDPYTVCGNIGLTDRYILPTVCSSRPYFVFEPGVRRYSLICDLYSAVNRQGGELDAFGISMCVLSELAAESALRSGDYRPERAILSLRAMLDYIDMHYSEHITLADIARAGSVCRSGCNYIFRKYLHRAPVDYLIDFRLRKAKELLGNTRMKVIDAALEVGFSSVNYFTQRFKHAYGVLPSAVRARKNER